MIAKARSVIWIVLAVLAGCDSAVAPSVKPLNLLLLVKSIGSSPADGMLLTVMVQNPGWSPVDVGACSFRVELRNSGRELLAYADEPCGPGIRAFSAKEGKWETFFWHGGAELLSRGRVAKSATRLEPGTYYFRGIFTSDLLRMQTPEREVIWRP